MLQLSLVSAGKWPLAYSILWRWEPTPAFHQGKDKAGESFSVVPTGALIAPVIRSTK